MGEPSENSSAQSAKHNGPHNRKRTYLCYACIISIILTLVAMNTLMRYPATSKIIEENFPQWEGETEKPTTTFIMKLIATYRTTTQISITPEGSYQTAQTERNMDFEDDLTQQPTCKFPHLTVDDPSIKKYLKEHSPLRCASMENWVYTQNGKFYIDKRSETKYGPISCTYFHIYRKDDDRWDELKLTNIVNGSTLPGDVFRVECDGAQIGKKYYKNLHVGVAYNRTLHERKVTTETPKLPLNVYIYLLDSMSRINFIRKLPKFYKLLTEDMEAVVMEGFNVVGDGTPWTMIPVTTGHFQTELYEGRKRFTNASYLDDWPLLFYDYRNAGYITSYAEEQPQFSFFSYKLKGFKRPPVDHYLRPFEQAIEWVRKDHRPYCLGENPRSLILCDWWREHQDMYKKSNIRTFSTLFSSETSHDDYNMVQVMDQHWQRKFREQFNAGYFNDTLLIIMGDHGRRFGDVRQTQTGKTEEKLPFLAMILPKWFKTVNPKSFKNLQQNSKRLVTPFDIYETLKAVINYTEDGGNGKVTERGISLFKAIPLERTCEDAYIRPHFCSCLAWVAVDDTSAEVTNAVKFIMSKINAELQAAGNACSELKIDKMISAKRLYPNEKLMAFKQSADYDNIFPDLTADANLTMIMYQLRFTVSPSGADFEVSIDYYKTLAEYRLSLDSISRLNMYGNQPHCILETHQHLRQFCYCVDLLNEKSHLLNETLIDQPDEDFATNTTLSPS